MEALQGGLEVVAGLVLSVTFVTGLGALLAFELGRMLTRDDEQREPDGVPLPRLERAT